MQNVAKKLGGGMQNIAKDSGTSRNFFGIDNRGLCSQSTTPLGLGYDIV